MFTPLSLPPFLIHNGKFLFLEFSEVRSNIVSYIKGGMQAKGVWKQDLSRVFGPKKDVNGEWRRLYDEELHSSYRSPNTVRVIKSRRLRWAGHVARIESGSAFKILTGKHTEETPIGMPGRRWERTSIRMDLKELGTNIRNWLILLRILLESPCEWGIQPSGFISHGVS